MVAVNSFITAVHHSANFILLSNKQKDHTFVCGVIRKLVQNCVHSSINSELKKKITVCVT